MGCTGAGFATMRNRITLCGGELGLSNEFWVQFMQNANFSLVPVRDDVTQVECSQCGERQSVQERCQKCDLQFGQVRRSVV